jgi:hypothetical protein
MARSKISKMPDEEVLKHYIPDEGLPALSGAGVHAREIVEKSLDSKPAFKKATLAIDRIMAKRKSAVIKSDKGSKKK